MGSDSIEKDLNTSDCLPPSIRRKLKLRTFSHPLFLFVLFAMAICWFSYWYTGEMPLDGFREADLQGLAKVMGSDEVVRGMSKSNFPREEVGVIRGLHDDLVTRKEADTLISMFDVSPLFLWCQCIPLSCTSVNSDWL